MKLGVQMVIVVLLFWDEDTEAQLNGDFTCMTMTVTIYVTLEPVTSDLSFW